MLYFFISEKVLYYFINGFDTILKYVVYYGD